MILRLVYSFFFFSLVTGNQRLEDSKKTTRKGLHPLPPKLNHQQESPPLITPLGVEELEDSKKTTRKGLHPLPPKLNHQQESPPLITPLGVEELEDAKKTTRKGLHPLPPILNHHQESPPLITPLRVEEVHYGIPPKGLISANTDYASNPTPRLETRSFDVKYVSDNENPNYQVPRPVQYIEDKNTPYKEKTICFTPSMVHRMIKAALEYVSHMPSDINLIIDKIDQELNRISEQDSIEEQFVKKSLYPLDSKTIFQMLDKPRPETRTNLILKYELPSAKEPQCREALEKLIEIAYNAYSELEHHPQCRDYLYKFASHHPEDRPRGHLESEPDLRDLIASILDQIDQHKPAPVSQTEYYAGEINIPIPEMPVSKINIPQIREITNSQVHEINIPQIHQINIPQVQEFSVPEIQEYRFSKTHEHNIPQVQEFSVPKIQEYRFSQTHEHNIPQVQEFSVPEIQEYRFSQTHEHNIPQVHEFSVPEIQEYRFSQTHEHNIPQVQEFSVPEIQEYRFSQTHEHNIPHVQEFSDPEIQEYRFSQTHENNIPQIHEYTIPEIQEYTIPEIYEIQKINIPQGHEIQIPKIHGPVLQETVPMRPEETVDILINLLKNNDLPDNRNLFDRFMNILEKNQNNFHPQIFRTLLNLLTVQKQQQVPKFNDLVLLLLDSERNKQLPWSEKNTEHILSYLIPDNTGNVDSRIVDIILNLHKQPMNEKHAEYVLSLLRPIKEGNLDTRAVDLILNLINSHQNNLLRPEHIDILLTLLKPTSNGIVVDAKAVDIINKLSRWNEIGLSPNNLDVIFTLLKPDLNGNMDHRSLDIIHFLLTHTHHLGPKNFNFILSFLYPENGIIDIRRFDIINFLLKEALPFKFVNILLTLLQENGPGVMNSRFLEILLFLSSNRLLTPELLETVINLLNDETTGNLDDNQVKTLFFQLAPFKQSNPKIVVDILRLLKQGGLYGNIVEWVETTNNNIGIPSRGSSPSKLHLLLEKVENLKGRLIEPEHNLEFRTPDVGHQTENDFMAIFKWLEEQGLLNPDQGGSNDDMVNKLLKILEMGERELGAVELTYMLKHAKPLVYQPIYYVKYRLPILSFISNMKTLLLEHPQLNSDPMKLLQELIVISNVTEVSPNLQGYPKEEILKLTVDDGDLVQAKILDEQNLKLNEQISYVHGLNADISPEDLLQLNRANEAKYYPSAMSFRGAVPDKVTVHEMDNIVEFPTVQYQHVQLNQGVPHPMQRHTIHYIEKQNLPHHKNVLLRPLK